MGGYHDESEFNGLELWALPEPLPQPGARSRPRRARSSSRPAARSAAARCSTGPTACGPPIASARSGRRARPRGPRRPRLRRAHGRGLGARLGVNDDCSDLNGPHSRAQGGLRGAAATTSAPITRNTDPDDLRPGHRRLPGLRRPVRARSARPRRPTWPTPPAAAPTSSSTAGSSGSWSRTAAPPGSRRPTPTRRAAPPRSRSARRHGRRRLRLDRVAGAAAALRDRRARRRRLPAPASDLGDLRLLRRGAGPWWGPPQAGLSHEFEDLDDGYGFLLECPQHTTGLTAAATPWRSGADHKRAMSKFAHGAGASST